MPGLFDTLKRGAFDLFSGAPEGAGVKEGLIGAGLATLAAPDKQDPLAQVAQGAMFGRQVGQETREKAKLEQDRAALQGFLQEAGYDRNGLTSAFFKAVASGDMELAGNLSEMIKSLPSTPTRALHFSEAVVRDPEDPSRWIRQQTTADPNTGAIIATRSLGEAADPTPPSMFENVREGVHPETGEPYVMGVERGTGRVIPLYPTGESSGGTGGAQGAMMAGLADNARQANTALAENDLDDELSGLFINAARRFGDTFLGDGTRWIANQISGDRAGLALTAGLNFINPSIRFLTGAQMNREEAGRYVVALLPVTADPPSVKAFKRRMRDSLVETMSTAGGGSGDGDAWLSSQDPRDISRVIQLSEAAPGTYPDLGLTIPGELFPPR